jgi:hypothetical protein
MCRFVLYSPLNNGEVEFKDLELINYKILELNKCTKRSNRNRKCRKTLDSLVRHRRLPEGIDSVNKLQKIKDLVMSQLEWATTARQVTLRNYNKIIGLLIAAMYTYGPQGRLQGLAHLREDQVNTVHNDALSSYIISMRYHASSSLSLSSSSSSSYMQYVFRPLSYWMRVT